RILPHHFDERGLIIAAAVRRRHRGNDRKSRVGTLEIVADTVVAPLLAPTALSRIGEHELIRFLDGIDRVSKRLGFSGCHRAPLFGSPGLPAVASWVASRRLGS